MFLELVTIKLIKLDSSNLPTIDYFTIVCESIWYINYVSVYFNILVYDFFLVRLEPKTIERISSESD